MWQRTWKLTVAGAAVCILPLSGLMAQQTAVPANARVRVAVRPYSPTAQQVRGPLVGELEAANDSIIIVRDARGTSVILPREDVHRFELSAGSTRSRSEGARRGCLVGAGTGVAIGLAMDTDGFVDGPVMALGFGALFGLLGAGIGAASSGERWRNAPVPHQLARAAGAITVLAGAGDGTRLGIRVSF
jgi:hypothetical protein